MSLSKLSALLCALAVSPAFACQNEEDPFDHDSVNSENCSWALAITEDTPATPFTVISTWADGGHDEYFAYEVEVNGGPRRLRLHIWTDSFFIGTSETSADDLALRIGRIFAQMPPIVHRSLANDTVLSTRNDRNPGGSNGAAYCNETFHPDCPLEGRSTIFMPSDTTLKADGTPKIWYEEYLLHEFAHMMQFTFAMMGLDIDKWEEAAGRDGQYVTEYAKEDIFEDHADSFVGWLLYRGYPVLWSHSYARRHIRNSMLRRIVYFDRQHRKFSLTNLWEIVDDVNVHTRHPRRQPESDYPSRDYYPAEHSPRLNRIDRRFYDTAPGGIVDPLP